MLKIVLLVLVILVLAALLGKKRAPHRPAPRAGGNAQEPVPLPMLACRRCGVHLPQVEALVDLEGRGYCCEAHRSAGPL